MGGPNAPHFDCAAQHRRSRPQSPFSCLPLDEQWPQLEDLPRQFVYALRIDEAPKEPFVGQLFAINPKTGAVTAIPVNPSCPTLREAPTLGLVASNAAAAIVRVSSGPMTSPANDTCVSMFADEPTVTSCLLSFAADSAEPTVLPDAFLFSTEVNPLDVPRVTDASL